MHKEPNEIISTGRSIADHIPLKLTHIKYNSNALYFAGLMTPFTLSEKEPKEQKGNVVMVVGNTFTDIVLDPQRDVLIMSYSRRSDACKTMDKVYKVCFHDNVCKTLNELRLLFASTLLKNHRLFRLNTSVSQSFGFFTIRKSDAFLSDYLRDLTLHSTI